MLVTGGASGIGKVTAQRWATKGARVALADLIEPELIQVVEAICAGRRMNVLTTRNVLHRGDRQIQPRGGSRKSLRTLQAQNQRSLRSFVGSDIHRAFRDGKLHVRT